MRQWFSKELRMFSVEPKKHFSVPSGCKTLILNLNSKCKSVWKTILQNTTVPAERYENVYMNFNRIDK